VRARPQPAAEQIDDSGASGSGGGVELEHVQRVAQALERRETPADGRNNSSARPHLCKQARGICVRDSGSRRRLLAGLEAQVGAWGGAEHSALGEQQRCVKQSTGETNRQRLKSLMSERYGDCSAKQSTEREGACQREREVLFVHCVQEQDLFEAASAQRVPLQQRGEEKLRTEESSPAECQTPAARTRQGASSA